MQAIKATRAGGHVGYVGVAHDVSLPGMELFFSGVHLHGGPAPVRRFLPQLIDLIWRREIDPGKVFDLTLPHERALRVYEAWTERVMTGDWADAVGVEAMQPWLPEAKSRRRKVAS